MNQALSAKQYVPLTEEELKLLRAEAVQHGISNGLLGRALLLHGLKRTADPTLVAMIEQENVAGRQRTSAGARAAVQVRWAYRDKTPAVENS